jgi:hypothetical protein
MAVRLDERSSCRARRVAVAALSDLSGLQGLSERVDQLLEAGLVLPGASRTICGQLRPMDAAASVSLIASCLLSLPNQRLRLMVVAPAAWPMAAAGQAPADIASMTDVAALATQ